MMQSKPQAPPKLYHFPVEETLLSSFSRGDAYLGTLTVNPDLQREISEFSLSGDQIIFGQGKRRDVKR